MKRLLALLCAIGLLCGAAGCANTTPLTVYDAQGAVIATIKALEFSDDELIDPSYRSYITLVLEEAVAAIADTQQCSTPKAQQTLMNSGYALYTAFDPAIHAAIDTMYDAHTAENLSLGCAIVDYNGNIRAVYSGGDEQYALAKHSPFSTIKPLSVYAPAVENGIVDWSTKLTDMPYKQLPNEAGQMKDWPVNPSQGYTYADTSLLECIKQSLNTTAVHCLKSVGVENSIRFLQDSFGMNLSYEQNKLTLEGEDEVIGNIAMGYLYTGVTPVDLAGYYQIFGNLGQYTSPHALTRIADQDGQTIYTSQSEPKQVIRENTAYIMNRLLSAVVTPGGTGAKAKIQNVELVGKTGTGNEDGGNWFVGVTPEYSCALWHGVEQKTGNVAASLFTEIAENLPAHEVTQFSSCATVRKGVYCSQSGKLFSSSCSQMQIGYYASDRKPAVCDTH